MSTNKFMKKNIPLILVFCLFFLWAISSNLLPTMIRQLMKTCELNTFEASFTESVYWLAYFICPIPIAMYLKRYSYKSGIVFGLMLAAFLVMAIVGNACVPQFTAFIMHHNEHIYQIAYIVPMICFAVCAAYGIKVLKS